MRLEVAHQCYTGPPMLHACDTEHCTLGVRQPSPCHDTVLCTKVLQNYAGSRTKSGYLRKCYNDRSTVINMADLQVLCRASSVGSQRDAIRICSLAPAPAAWRRSCRSIFPASRALRKNLLAAVAAFNRWDRQADGRTDRYIDPAPHIMRAASKWTKYADECHQHV